MYIPEPKEVLGSIYNQALDLPITFAPPIRKSPFWSPPSKFRYPDTVALPLISTPPRTVRGVVLDRLI